MPLRPPDRGSWNPPIGQTRGYVWYRVSYFMFYSQLSGISSETIHLKACLSHGKRLIPTLAAHFDPYSDFPLPPAPPMTIETDPFSARDREEEKEEASLCPGGRLISLNVSADERVPKIHRIMVPYPAEGEWFLTLLPSCSQVNVRRGSQET